VRPDFPETAAERTAQRRAHSPLSPKMRPHFQPSYSEDLAEDVSSEDGEGQPGRGPLDSLWRRLGPAMPRSVGAFPPHGDVSGPERSHPINGHRALDRISVSVQDEFAKTCDGFRVG